MLRSSYVPILALQANHIGKSDLADGFQSTGAEIALGSSTDAPAANSDSLIEREEPETVSVSCLAIGSLPLDRTPNKNSDADSVAIALTGAEGMNRTALPRVQGEEFACTFDNPLDVHGSAMAAVREPGALESWNTDPDFAPGTTKASPPSGPQSSNGMLRLSDVTNEEFRDAVFHSLGSKGRPVVCTKWGVPHGGSWSARPASELTKECKPFANNYLNCSTYRATSEGLRAKSANFMSMNALMLDDVGGKVALDRLSTVECSWRLETSPGNYQVGFIFSPPITNPSEAEALVRAVAKAGLCDPDATGHTRWMRLPVGINGKEKHRQPYGPFRCRLTEWRPNNRFDLSGLISALGINVEFNTQLESQVTRKFKSISELPDSDQSLSKATALLEVIDPDSGYSDWLQVLQAVHYISGGSNSGLDLVDAWSSQGVKYQSRRELETKWESFRNYAGAPITLGTLVMLAKKAGANAIALMANSEKFEICEMEVVRRDEPEPNQPAVGDKVQSISSLPHSLSRFSITGQSDYIRQLAGTEVAVLGKIALKGQATVIYAAPNTGKTLLTLHFVMEAIREKRIKPERMFYLNVDDNTSGLYQKTQLAEMFGFHILADGYERFMAKNFIAEMRRMIATDTVDGAIVILDTLKKFVDTMSKAEGRNFTGVARQFVLKGGTVIALAHTNKKSGLDGKKVFAGTSDIVDDFDCAYILSLVSKDAQQTIVEFENIKSRGNVVDRVAYNYINGSGKSYEDMILSIDEVDLTKVDLVKSQAVLVADTVLIDAIKMQIHAGKCKKMELVAAVKDLTKATKVQVLTVLERYTGDDPSIHHWTFDVMERGANVFRLIEPTPDAVSFPVGIPQAVREPASIPVF